MKTGMKARMTVQEVLRRYAAGERKFCNANLGGANFKGQDLSGADFSGADIRSANFAKANLQGVNFSHAKAGWKGSVVFQHKCLIALYAFIAILFQGFLAAFISLAFSGSTLNLWVGLAVLFSFISVLIILGWKGFTDESFFAIVVVLSSLFVVISQIESSSSVEDLGIVALIAIALSIGTGLHFMAVLLSSILLSKRNTSLTPPLPLRAILVVCLLTITTTVFISLFRPFSVAAAIASACFLTITTSIFCLHVVQKTLIEKPTYTVIREWLLGTITSNGGRFCGADLSGANFRFAQIKGANFSNSRDQPTRLRHVCWKNSVGIHFAKFSNDVMQNRKVRSLLTATESGYKADFTGINFRGSNLSGITLEKANLTQAILSDALLVGTILKDAVLTETQAVSTNFTSACLTGATIESWNIDSTTILNNIDCDYVYLLEHPEKSDDRERRPHDITKMFQPGDFEKLFKEVQDEVQLLIRNGLNPGALRCAFQRIRENYPELSEDALQSFQRRENDILVTVQVPQSIDKSEFERDWYSGYQAGLQAGREESAALLASAEKRADSLEAIALTMAQNPPSIQNSQNMTANDHSQTIEVQGNVESSVIGQGDHNNLTNASTPKNDPKNDSVL